MQLFHNDSCTEYAHGDEDVIYARVNVPWGFNGGWRVEGATVGDGIECAAPFNDDPTQAYQIYAWEGYFDSGEYENPFTAGEVVTLYENGDMDPIANPTVIFTKP